MNGKNRQAISFANHRINFEDFLICLLILTITLAAISYILVSQDSLTDSSLWIMVRYTRLSITIICSVYLISHAIISRKMDYKQVKVFLCLFYAFVVVTLLHYPKLSSVFDTLAWPLVYLVFYLYCKDFGSIEKFYSFFLFMHTVICLLLVRTIWRQAVGEYANSAAMYHALAFIPLTLYIPKNRFRILLFVFSAILVLLSAKRAGIIALVLGFSGYLLISVVIQSDVKKKARKIFFIIVIGIIVFSIAMYFSSFIDRIVDRFNDLVVDQGSGRGEIWKMVYNDFKKSSLINKVFGHGIQSVLKNIRPFDKALFAHNSFLEYLYDLGIIGLLMLVTIVFNMIVFVIQLIKTKSEVAPSAAYALCIVLCLSMFSYCFEESNFILWLACYWGSIQGCCIHRKLNSAQMEQRRGAFGFRNSVGVSS